MWQAVEINGRPADCFAPAEGPFPGAVIYLHGYAGESLRDNPTFTALFEKHRLPVLAPQGGTGWWLNQACAPFGEETTPMQFLQQDAVNWIRDRWGIAPPRIALLGVSMGGQGAINLAYRHARTFPIVAALAPALDFHQIHGKGYGVEDLFESAEAARQETALLHLHPLNWPKHQFFCCDPLDKNWIEGCRCLASKLSSTGIPFQSDLESSHGGHGWPYFNAMADRAVGFIGNALRSSELSVEA